MTQTTTPTDDRGSRSRVRVAAAVGAGSESEAGFRVDEELASIGAATAVGRAQNVEGTLTIDGTAVSDVEVAVDLASLQADDSRRDNRLRDALAVEEFPMATFALTEPIALAVEDNGIVEFQVFFQRG